jgi:hypothetical protein
MPFFSKKPKSETPTGSAPSSSVGRGGGGYSLHDEDDMSDADMDKMIAGADLENDPELMVKIVLTIMITIMIIIILS